MKFRVPVGRPQYTSPAGASARSVVGALKTGQAIGRATEQAQGRRLKLQSALGKLQK